MNVKLLDGYKNIGLPTSYLIEANREVNREVNFREVDSPLAFLDLDKNQQQILYDWCMTLEKMKVTNKKNDSYNIKHVFEDAENGFYICNGAFKGAMILAGFEVKDVSKLNWHFNVSNKEISKPHTNN